MPTTCKLIAKNVLGSDTASVTFSDIPDTYTDLLLVVSARTNRALYVDYIKARFNGASADTNHSTRELLFNAGSVTSTTASAARISAVPGSTVTASTFSNSETLIPNYAGSSAKSFSSTGVTENNSADSVMNAVAGLWNSTAAITSIQLLPNIGTSLVSGSSFFLYGITKA